MPGQGYIGAMQFNPDGEQVLIGTTLYGECNTNAELKAKVVTLPKFDGLTPGVTIFVKFTQGNSLLLNNDNAFTLKVGTTNEYPIKGNCVCDMNEIVAFTLEVDNSGIIPDYYWRAHKHVKIEIDNNIITKIDGQQVNIATQTYVDNKSTTLPHKLTFGAGGAYEFDGSADVTVPVYTGTMY